MREGDDEESVIARWSRQEYTARLRKRYSAEIDAAVAELEALARKSADPEVRQRVAMLDEKRKVLRMLSGQ